MKGRLNDLEGLEYMYFIEVSVKNMCSIMYKRENILKVGTKNCII